MPKTYFPAVISLSELTGKNGFKINGAVAGDHSGKSVSHAGDVNRDGFNDLLIGAIYADHNDKSYAGSSYVVFGKNTTWVTPFELSSINGTNGFRINGELANDHSGKPVSNAGDVNGDGFNDLLIGATYADPNGKNYAGSSYVVFGHDDVWSNAFELSTLDGLTGFKLNGELAYDYSGSSLSSAGDINGDGFDDIIIGAPASGHGAGYVVFGKNSLWATPLELSTLDGENGFRIDGEATDNVGSALSSAGDINGDGFDDIIIGVFYLDPYGVLNAGGGYVIFGTNSTWTTPFELSAVNGTNGFKILGEGRNMSDRTGYTVSGAGDINGDGIDDFIITAPYADPDGKSDAGISYVVFGKAENWDATLELLALDGANGFRINGEIAGDHSGYSASSAGDINSDGFDDIIIGAPNAYVDGVADVGSTYVIFGHDGIWPNSIELSDLNGGNGFKINGEAVGDASGYSISSAGDINSDGIDDIIIGADYADSQGRTDAGASYVIFGDVVTAELVANQLTINEGETETITLSNLNVINDSHEETLFLISALEHGYFEYTHYSGRAIDTFSKADVENNHIRFVHDGSEYAPAYNVTIYSEKFGHSDPFPVDVTFDNNINDVPELFIRRRGLKYIEKSTAQTIAPDLTIIDPDTPSLVLASATVAITNNFNDGQDSLGFVNQNGISGDYDDATGILTLTGSASIADYQSALRSVTYENLASSTTFGPRMISFTVSDGGSINSLPETCEVNVVKPVYFPSTITLSSLNGKNGFRMDGETYGYLSGQSVSGIGDINGDGFDDFIIGAPEAKAGAETDAGLSYVIFGKNSTWTTPVELSALDGINGFKIEGKTAYSHSGRSVSGAGDINGDGIDDFVIGAYAASIGGEFDVGASYVIFGHHGTWPSTFALSALDGTTGFAINGEIGDDYSGWSVSNVGDFNDDGIDDFVIGAYGGDNGVTLSVGASYIVFGYDGVWPSVLELSDLNGTTGFKIFGESAQDMSGYSVSNAGDINGDGVSDLVIGAPLVDVGEESMAGASYVIFGGNKVWPNPLELSTLDGVIGFKMYGQEQSGRLGRVVGHAGDINGDGYDDLIIAAPYAHLGGIYFVGCSYVIFGHNETWPSVFDLSSLNGETGFRIDNDGTPKDDYFGNSIGSGDINKDGVADLIIGAPGENYGGVNTGGAYIIFGRDTAWPSVVELSTLDGVTGLKIIGEGIDDQSGYSVDYAGDIDGDGIADLIIGAPYLDLPARNSAGAGYVIFGDTVTAEVIANQLTIHEGETKVLTLSDLDVADDYHAEIRYVISDVTHGYFENVNDVGNAITTFSKADIENNDIRFVHDGDEYAPTYNVTIYSERFAYSEPFASDITFTNVNDVPELSIRRRLLKYVEGNFPQVVAPDLVITDVDLDAVNIANATVAITHDFNSERDVLGFANQNGITGDYDDTTGALTLTGSSSIENYQAALRSVTYENLAEVVKFGTRTASFTVNDGVENSLPVTCDIKVVKETVFPAEIELSNLNGKNGFKLNGEAKEDFVGHSVSGAGDINHDGFGDLIIGAHRAAPDEKEQAGSSYVIFGHMGDWATPLELSSLDGESGFKINGKMANDRSGHSVSSAGDINADGIDDFIIGAPGAASEVGGSSYVVFGHEGGWSSQFDPSTLNGIIGFDIIGESFGDASGYSVSNAGDINGDGVDDLIIGASSADPNGGYSGSSYVVFGHNGTWPSSLALSTLDGTTGFKINGEAANDESGHSVSCAGDINGDGFDDLIIGTFVSELTREDEPGLSYVVFGHNGAWPSSLELSGLDGTDGFRINGEIEEDHSGWSVSNAGDINGDGIADIIVGASGADPNGQSKAGSSYVIFGQLGPWTTPLELSTLDGMNGFKLNGKSLNDYSGWSVSSAGDINGDGIDDLMIGAYGVNSVHTAGVNQGVTYVVFGHVGNWTTPLELSTLTGANGFKITGEVADDRSGYSVSNAGDVNGDGIDDIIIGAYYADPNGDMSGSSYVVFGDAFTAELVVNQLTISEGETKTITLSDLNASDSYHNETQFTISALEHGYFENINDVGTPITGFNKTAIENNQIRFVHDGDEYAPAYNVTIHSERFAYSKPFTADITFTNVNDAPQLTTTVSPLAYVENEVKAIDSDIVVTDSDSTDLVNATVAITNNFYFYDVQDMLGFVDQSGIMGSYNNATGILTLIGTSSLANYQTALRNVTYENLSDNPSTDIRTITFAANDGLASSLPATRDINITPINDAPVLIATSTPLNYTENDPAIVIDPNIAIFDDPDHVNFVGAKVSIENNYHSGQDILGFINQNNIVGVYHGDVGILSLTGTASESNYQTALREVTFENLSDDPITGTRTIKFLVNDGDHESAGVTRDINIFAVNDLPVITGSGGTFSYTEHDSATVIDPAIAITDPDNTDLTNAAVAITNNFHAGEDSLTFTNQPMITHIDGAYNSMTGIITLTGTANIDNYQEVLRSVKYYNPSDNPTASTRTVSFAVNDGNDNSNTITRNINIVPENDPPVLGNNRLTIEEGKNVTLTANELSATDIDNDDADLEFTVNSVLRGQFKSKYVSQEVMTFAQRNITEGDIAFVHDGSHSAPSYSVRVSDGNLLNVGGFQLADIDFTPENDIPILTRNELSINQGQKKIFTDSNLDATDEETPKADLVFTVSDMQHGYFEDLLTTSAITTFIQSKIADGDIQFVHDGSEQAPSYAVSVSDGDLATAPKESVVQFTQAQTTTEEETGLLSKIQNGIVLGGISGGIGFLFLVMRIYFYRKATSNFKDLTSLDASDRQHKDFQQRVLRPIAEAIFDRIKITGCMGYISEQRMRDYLDAVMKIIVELDQLQVDVNLDHISAAGQSLLVNEIAKQTKRVLVPRQACCSCGCCARCLCKICAAEVSPEGIERNAAVIAMAVKNSLQQNHFDTFLSRQSVTTPTDVGIDFPVREEPIEMQTLGNVSNMNHVGMFALPAETQTPMQTPMEMPIQMPTMQTVDVRPPSASMPMQAPYASFQGASRAAAISMPAEEARPKISSFSRDLSQQGFVQQNQMVPR